MPRFGCVTRAVCRASGPARSRRRARDESVAVWAFQKKQAAGKIDRHVAGCRRAACAARYRRSRRRCADCASSDNPPTLEQRELLDAFAAQLALFREQGARAGRKPDRANCPPIPEASESAFRFRLARTEDAARRDVGCVATDRATGSRGVAAGRAAPHPHGRSFARRDASGIGPLATGA